MPLPLPRSPAPPIPAHLGVPPEPHDLPTDWSLEPAVLFGLALLAFAYARGARTLWRRAGPGRGLSRGQVAALVAAWLSLLLALVSPLDALGAALFSAHMVQHMLLVLVAAPLLVLSAPGTALLWALSAPDRRRLGRWWRRAPAFRAVWHALTRPAVAWLLHAATIWLWHLPGPYQAALADPAVHAAEHASFLAAAGLFWWVVFGGAPRERLHPALGVFYLFTTALQEGILGALMTFARAPWYPAYAPYTPAWGLTPLDDQQLAGLIMWVPAGLVYLAAALIPLAALLRDDSERPFPHERPIEHLL